MAHNHLETIKAKAMKLSALTGSAGSFLTIDLLNTASKQLYLAIKDIIDEDTEDTLYEQYIAYLELGTYDPTIAFHLQTDLQRKYDGLVQAETYLALSELAIALKKIDKNSVIYDKETFGGDTLDPAMIDNIVAMADIWRKKASKTLADTLVDDDTGVLSQAYMGAI